MKCSKFFKKFITLAAKIPVSCVMTTDVIEIHEDNTVHDAICLMSKESISALIIVKDDKTLAGIISEGDILSRVLSRSKDPKTTLIKNIMTKTPISVTPNMSISNASTIMEKKNISRFPVLSKGKVIGFVSKTDILKKINQQYKNKKSLLWLTFLNAIQFIIIAVLAYYILKTQHIELGMDSIFRKNLFP